MLKDFRSAPISERVKAALAFLEKLTLEPQRVGPDDIAPMRAAGLSDDAIAEAIHVAVVFNIIDRVADALGFHVAAKDVFAQGATRLLEKGYV